MCEPHIQQEARPPRTWPWSPRTTLHHRASIWSTWPVYKERSPLINRCTHCSSRRQRRSRTEKVNVKSTATITRCSIKSQSLCDVWNDRCVEWTEHHDGEARVCANNSRDKTSIHVFPRNDETVKHFLVALSAELMLSTLTGMFSVFHGQFSPAYCLSQWLTLPTSTRLVTMTMQADCSCHTILQKSYTVSCTGPAHTADTLHDYNRIGKKFFLCASRLCKVSYPE